MKVLAILLFSTLCILLLSAEPVLDSANVGKSAHAFSEELSFDPNFYEESEAWLVYDNNLDGIIDFATLYDENGQKLREVIDHNTDAVMDDFYFYEDASFVRQEIDYNDDARIDIWIYIVNGLYIQGYERDTDYDGIIDAVQIYE